MQQHWYLRMGEGKESNIERLLFDPDNRPVVGLLDFLTLFILYSSLIPISLYVSIEIIKFFQVCCSYTTLLEAMLLILYCHRDRYTDRCGFQQEALLRPDFSLLQRSAGHTLHQLRQGNVPCGD